MALVRAIHDELTAGMLSMILAQKSTLLQKISEGHISEEEALSLNDYLIRAKRNKPAGIKIEDITTFIQELINAANSANNHVLIRALIPANGYYNYFNSNYNSEMTQEIKLQKCIHVFLFVKEFEIGEQRCFTLRTQYTISNTSGKNMLVPFVFHCMMYNLSKREYKLFSKKMMQIFESQSDSNIDSRIRISSNDYSYILDEMNLDSTQMTDCLIVIKHLDFKKNAREIYDAIIEKRQTNSVSKGGLFQTKELPAAVDTEIQALVIQI